jgi:hypothetical protein
MQHGGGNMTAPCKPRTLGDEVLKDTTRKEKGSD